MKEHLSPEEKLLRLIKGKPLKLERTPQVLAHSMASKWLSPKRGWRQVLISAAGVKMVLGVSFIFSCIYLGFSLAYPFFGLRTIILPKADVYLGREIVQAAPKEDKLFEYYLEAVQGKQIFGGAALQEPGAASERGNTELIKDFNLMGVISGDNPQAVIEDKKVQKNFTVTTGQFIGEFQVEDIKEGKVMLNHQGQKFELFI